jgi:hypothetical protein
MKNRDLLIAIEALSDAAGGVLAVPKELTPEQREKAIRETNEWLKNYFGGEKVGE